MEGELLENILWCGWLLHRNSVKLAKQLCTDFLKEKRRVKYYSWYLSIPREKLSTRRIMDFSLPREESPEMQQQRPCSPLKSVASTSPVGVCGGSWSYLRYHRRSSRHCSSNLNSSLNSEHQEFLTTTMRLTVSTDLEATSSQPPVITMNNCPSDLSTQGAVTEEECTSVPPLTCDDVEDEAGDLMGNTRRFRRARRCSSSTASSSSHFFPSSSSRTGLFFTFLSVALLILLGGVDGLRINQFGGYEDVVVSVGSDVPPITCQQLIQNLQVSFIYTSSFYYHTHTYFASFAFIFSSLFNKRKKIMTFYYKCGMTICWMFFFM